MSGVGLNGREGARRRTSVNLMAELLCISLPYALFHGAPRWRRGRLQRQSPLIGALVLVSNSRNVGQTNLRYRRPFTTKLATRPRSRLAENNFATD